MDEVAELLYELIHVKIKDLEEDIEKLKKTLEWEDPELLKNKIRCRIDLLESDIQALYSRFNHLKQYLK